MSDHCHHDHGADSARSDDPRYRRILWIALIINAAMFAVEIGGGLTSGSVSLLADAVDFGGDAANYGLSLAVLSMGLAQRARAALVKAATMGLFGLLVLVKAGWSLHAGVLPEPTTMGVIGAAGLLANLTVAFMLYAYREGDANMRSVWLCTRNDAIGNMAVMAAALGVFGSGSGWPDLLVAVAMACLAMSSAVSVAVRARAELRSEHRTQLRSDSAGAGIDPHQPDSHDAAHRHDHAQHHGHGHDHQQGGDADHGKDHSHGDDQGHGNEAGHAGHGGSQTREVA